MLLVMLPRNYKVPVLDLHPRPTLGLPTEKDIGNYTQKSIHINAHVTKTHIILHILLYYIIQLRLSLQDTSSLRMSYYRNDRRLEQTDMNE